MSERERQALLARFLDDPTFEAAVRRAPATAATTADVEPAFTAWLAQLDPRRVEAFRRSRVHKDELRSGKKQMQ